MRKFTLSGLPWLSSKPSKRELAVEIDQLNFALSNAGNTQAKTEKLWTMAEENVTVLGRSLARANQKLERYDETALAEARRLAVLQIFGGYAHNLNEAAAWLATGTWTATEEPSESEWLGDMDIAPQMMPAGSDKPFEFRNVDRILSGDDGPEPEIGTTTVYAHGYIKGWNSLLDKIQAQLVAAEDGDLAAKLEPLRHSFKRTEAM